MLGGWRCFATEVGDGGAREPGAGAALQMDGRSGLRERRCRDARERVPAAGRRRAVSGDQASVAGGGARASSEIMAWYSQSSRKFVFAKRTHTRRAVRTMYAAVRIT